MEMIAYTEQEVFPIIATEGFTIAENRHYCVAQAQKAGCTHLLFIDDDMTFPKETIGKLLAHQKKVVGVKSYSRKLPLRPTVALLGDEGQPVTDYVDTPMELFKCYSVGFGVCLIDMSLFEELQRPFFDFSVTPIGKVYIGEDEYFCNKVREKGYDIYCDPTLLIGHIGDYTYGTV